MRAESESCAQSYLDAKSERNRHVNSNYLGNVTGASRDPAIGGSGRATDFQSHARSAARHSAVLDPCISERVPQDLQPSAFLAGLLGLEDRSLESGSNGLGREFASRKVRRTE